MAVETAERRLIVLQSADRRFDLSLPCDEALNDALVLTGLPAADRFIVIGPGGHPVSGDTLCEDLVDGALYALVDPASAPLQGLARTAAGPTRWDHGARWWVLAVLALVLFALFAQSGDALVRTVVGVLLCIGAVTATAAWARRDADRGASTGLGVLAPVLLSFTAAAILIPAGLANADHLSATAGLLAAGVSTAVVALTAPATSVRAAAGTASILLVILAALWGAMLLMQWGPVAAAAVSAGLVPLGLRALPSSLINLPEGYFIDYKHFMSSRWTVRGAIPERQGRIRSERIRAVVDGSSARMTAGTAVISVAAALMTPFAVLRSWSGDGYTIAGGVALLVCVALSLLLTPRHTSSKTLRWMPRGAAVVILVTAAIHIGTVSGRDVLPVVAGLLFVAGLMAVALVVPMSRGARSLGWSRAGDFFEWLAVALSLPAALLYADVLSLLRGMMSA